jgi:Flp pilus assembly protein TadG
MNPTDIHEPASLARRAARLLKRLRASNDGIAAVEFAVIAPVMITMFFGVTEITDAYTARTKVTEVASTAGDLVAQEKTICDSDMTDVFSALTSVMSPYSAASLKVVVTSLVDSGNNQVKVAWSDGYNTAARNVGDVVAIPNGLVTSGSGGSVIMAEVTYTYTSPVGEMFNAPISFSDTFYLHPRKVAQVARTTTCS